MTRYLVSLYEFLEHTVISSADKQKIASIAGNFSLADAHTVSRLEQKTNHDLKAIEQFLVISLTKKKLGMFVPFVNLAIGSEDINSIALSWAMGECRNSVLLTHIQAIARTLVTIAIEEKDTAMVARTHGIAANITTFGKELSNTLSRLCDEIEILKSLSFSAKCIGEVGSLQSFTAVGNTYDWLVFTDGFIHSFGLVPSHASTQIAPYDSLVRFFQSLERINSILLDFVQNMWLFVLLGYIKVKKVKTEVGSAGMPHKVNPIYFEGAEGGLKMANGILETLSRILPINRLSRDFSDSTARRSVSMPLGLSVLSYQSIVEGLSRLDIDRDAIASDFGCHQEVFLESVKIYCMRHGVITIYDWLKDKTRGKTFAVDEFGRLLAELPLKPTEKQELQTMLKSGNPYPATIVDEVAARAKDIFHI